jgi:triphosphatase
MATELEIKLEVGDLQKLDCLLCDPMVREKMAGDYRYTKMDTTYYDTASGALREKQWALRLRLENGRPVVTFKTAGEGYERGEWECHEQYLEDALPKLVVQGAPRLLTHLFHGEPPIPVCRAQFTRISADLHFPDGSRCELAGDIGELAGGARHQDLCELELERKEGSEAAMLAFARELQEKYGLREEPLSKFARARALADQ